MLVLLIIQVLIFIASLFFGVRYLYLHSFKNKALSINSFKSIGLLLFYLPVFRLCLILLLLGIKKFYKSIEGIYLILTNVKEHIPVIAKDFETFASLHAIVCGSLLVPLLAWLGKLSLTRNHLLERITSFIFYLIASIAAMFFCNEVLPMLVFFDLNPYEGFFNNAIHFIAAYVALAILCLLSTKHTSKHEIAKYYKLTAKIISSYILIVLFLAVSFFLFVLVATPLFEAKITGVIIEHVIKAVPFALLLFFHGYLFSKTWKHENEVVKIISVVVSSGTLFFTIYKMIITKLELTIFVPYLLINLWVLFVLSVIQAVTSNTTNKNHQVKKYL